MKDMEPVDINGVRVLAHQAVLAALIMTHPNPKEFADVLERVVAVGQVQWANHGLVTPETREIALDIYEELRDVAREAQTLRNQT